MSGVLKPGYISEPHGNFEKIVSRHRPYHRLIISDGVYK